MIGRPAAAIPGYASVTIAARELGVTTQTIYRHLHTYGSLSRLKRFAAAMADPRGIALPGGGFAATLDDAARALGVSRSWARERLCNDGNLDGAGASRRVRSTEGAGAALRVSLAEVGEVDVPAADPRPETAPRGGNYMVSAAPVDVGLVIATIRQCRDDFLAERGVAA